MTHREPLTKPISKKEYLIAALWIAGAYAVAYGVVLLLGLMIVKK